MKKAFRNSTIIQDVTRLMTQKFHLLFLKTELCVWKIKYTCTEHIWKYHTSEPVRNNRKGREKHGISLA